MTALTSPKTYGEGSGQIPKSPTGIGGLDELLGGGLPTGRPTLITGGPGSGKTMLGVEFLVHGILDYGEPGVLMAFEESAADLSANMASLGFDLDRLQADGLLVVDSLEGSVAEIIESGLYDLDGLFIRLGCAVDAIGAKRVFLDTLEILFGAFGDQHGVRSELGRLFRWLKRRGLTAVVTGERDGILLTRRSIEDYVSDCVIVLDHRVREGISTRRLRVVKYRGSIHGTNEYPFLISEKGITVLPITSLQLSHDASPERVSSGVDRLDHMLGGGVFRGSTVLLSGDAGTGKTSLAASLVDATCRRGERAVFASSEESPAQLVRNMASIGIDLQKWVDAGLLRIWAERPISLGLERHLARLLSQVEEFAPSTVVLDALASLAYVGEGLDVSSAVTREIDLLKARGITAVMTTLSHGNEPTLLTVSSLVDTWILLRNAEEPGERNRLLIVGKSRGSRHSNQLREFLLTESGPRLLDVYIGPGGVLTGSARLAQETHDRLSEQDRRADLARRQLALERRRADAEAQIMNLRREIDADFAEFERSAAELGERDITLDESRFAVRERRWADPETILTGEGLSGS